MSIDQVLVQIGLQETEAKFYLAALELGQASVRDIAAKAGISRTNAYDVFSRLLEQGLVTQVGAAANKIILIAAEPPDQITELLDARRRKLDALLPELRSMHNGATGKPRVRFYQGSEGIKLVLDDTLSARNKSLLGILSMRDLYEVPGRAWMDNFVRRRIEAGVFLRVVRSPAKDVKNVWPQSTADLREVRFASFDFVFTMTSYIYDNKVAIISSRRENFAMTIESEEFATMQRNLFEVFWASCPAPWPKDAKAKGNKAKSASDT
ncbi:MAG: helix-turn-helix domain-containing protein [Pseudolabrys sp.]|nr:helix-turn-helix domain-containing protein [Pseudolabrys sp.]MDP2297088.1 helix-turn-helix domain-containing protein [Pseudolabrys sp.]